MSFYKPTKDEIEKCIEELNDKLENKPNQNISNNTTPYSNYLIELSNEDNLLNHFDSLERLRKNGFENHLPIDLQMNIMIDLYKNRLDEAPANFSNLIKKLTNHVEIWTANLIEIRNDRLFIYDNSDGLLWNKASGSYLAPPDNLNYRPNGTSFNIKLSSGSLIPQDKDISIFALNDVNKELVKKLFYSFEELPEIVKLNSRIKIPKSNKIYPLTKGDVNSNTSIRYYDGLAKSIGCKQT